MAMTIEQAMRHAAQVVELYDDALSGSNEMATSTDCAEVLNALADYHAIFTQPAQAVDMGAIREVIAELSCTSHQSLQGAADFCGEQADKLTRAIGNAQAEGWRPIETAPKDGTPVILGYAKSHSCEGFWMGKPERNHWGETGWFDSDSDVLCEHPHRPDAWMPLPTPPQPEE